MNSKYFWSASDCWLRLTVSLVVLATFAGCDRGEVKVYRVAKSEPAPNQPPHAGHTASTIPDGHPEIQRAKPQLAWTLPSGWTEAPASRMSLANFNITGTAGQEAQVTVTPLAGLEGKEVAIVNMWRQQVGQTELSPEEVAGSLQPVDIAGAPGKMFEVTGNPEALARPMRIVTAMAHRPDASWFYKLQGDAELVEAQKPAFVAFLKSIKITDAPAATPEPVASAATGGSATASKWNAPAKWKAVSPGQMQVAKFLVPDKDSAKADVAISVFPNSTGGNLANVNRWRNQIGLPPASESDLAQLVKPLDEKNPEAILVDMTNSSSSRQLVGAIVPRGGQWYFFKLLGDAAAVAPQKEAFTKFVLTSNY